MGDRAELGNEPVGDRELVGWALDASQPRRRKKALEMIAERYLQDVLTSTARRMGDAEAASDVTQQTFTDVCDKLMKGEGPQNPDRLGGWLHNFSRNRERNHYKRREANRERSRPADDHGDEFGSGISRVGVARDDEERLVQARGIAGRVARTLAADEQEIYRLYYEQEFSVAEVTEQLTLSGRKLSQKTVQNKVTRVAAVVATGFEAYLLVQHDRTSCGRLTAIIGRYPQEFGSEVRDHVLKHARKCADCGSCTVCPTCRVRDVLAISTCEKSAGCRRCLVCDSERVDLKAQWAPALVLLLFLRPVRTVVLQAVNQAWSEAISVLSSPPTNPPSSPPGPPSAVGPLRRPAARTAKVATAAVATAAVVAGALLLTRPDTNSSSPQTAPVAATMPTIAYATDKEVRVQTKERNTTVDTVPVGSTVTDLIWSADRRRLGWLVRPSQGTAVTLHTRDLSTGRNRTWDCQDCSGLAFQGANLVSVRQGAEILSHPPTGKAPKSLELQGIDTTTAALQLFLVGSTAADSELLIFTIDNDVSGADANKLYRMAANKMVTTVVDDALRHIPGGARRPGQYAAVSRDGTRLAYGGNVSGGDPCVPSDGVTVVDLDTGKHATTALADDDASRRLRITGVWFGPKDEVWASAFRQPAEACVAYGEEEASRRQRTVVYRLHDGAWTKSDQEAVMAQPAEDGWSARRAGATGLNDYRPPASPLVVTNSKNQRVPLGDSVTVFAWAPGDSKPAPVLGTLWGPYQKGYGLPKPTTVYNGGSPSGMVRDVTWTSWGDERATGTGEAIHVTGEASVAESPWEKSTVVAFDLGDCFGVRTYRKVSWFHPQRNERFDESQYMNVCTG
ncbi:sigma-70 family RNA polymerase sigma factor [Streptomyces sp. BV286]|uniref:sigma-70 family RNA polymerase sigma factor n=1 Tax=Streptomyces sp. BV286 TaxID=2849672 RepID=UPI001C2E5654|nr:sigma-70 family RNA polymerase sigma factor [Streptomyces sp. BV286]MBV1935940.1 sigma-70 family RNA polymerase sigma factor [Streptomyces sp. BV286]